MNPILLPGLASLCLSLAFTPVVRDIALKVNLIDNPDNHRKVHTTPVARAGGVAVALAWFGSLALLFLQIIWIPEAAPSIALIQKLFIPAFIMFGTGLLDDVIGLRPRHKLMGQFAAALALVFSGITIESFAGNILHPVVGGAIAVVWLVGCTNAFNLIDGLDGLASGIGLIASLTTMTAALLIGDTPIAVVMLPLAMALFGFLRYNFHPASVFLGDSGSLFIGFLLGTGALLWSNAYGFGWSAVAAPMMALAVPLLDLSVSVVRRFLTERPIFGADRGHIHHRLLSLGLTPRNAAVTLYGFAGITAVLALVETSAHDHVGALVGVLFCCVVLGGVRRLGYVEFGAVHDAVSSGAIRRLLSEEIRLRQFEIALREASTVDEHWTAMQTLCRELGFVASELKLQDVVLSGTAVVPLNRPNWSLRVQFGADGHLAVIRTSVNTQTRMLERSLELFSKQLESRMGQQKRPSQSEVAIPSIGGELIRPGQQGPRAVDRTWAKRARG